MAEKAANKAKENAEHMRSRDGAVRKRHVPEPERLWDQAGYLKEIAAALLREADLLLAEAGAFEAAEAGAQKTDSFKLTHYSRLLRIGRRNIPSQNARVGPELVIVVKRHIIEQSVLRVLCWSTEWAHSIE